MTVCHTALVFPETLLDPHLDDLRVLHGINGTRPISSNKPSNYLQMSGIDPYAFEICCGHPPPPAAPIHSPIY